MMGDYVGNTWVQNTDPPINAVRLNALDRAVEQAHFELNTSGHKQPVRAASISNLTLSGTQSVDGVSTMVGDRILVKDQTTSSQNGIYIASAGAWTRAPDANTTEKYTPYHRVFVHNGYYNYRTEWFFNSATAPTLGTTSIFYFRRMTSTVTIPINNVNLTLPVGSAITELIAGRRMKVDLSILPEIRVVANIVTASANANCVIRPQFYNTSTSTWNEFGSPSTELNIACNAPTGVKDTGWKLNAGSGGRTDVEVRFIIQGNTTSSGVLGLAYVMFR